MDKEVRLTYEQYKQIDYHIDIYNKYKTMGLEHKYMQYHFIDSFCRIFRLQNIFNDFAFCIMDKMKIEFYGPTYNDYIRTQYSN